MNHLDQVLNRAASQGNRRLKVHSEIDGASTSLTLEIVSQAVSGGMIIAWRPFAGDGAAEQRDTSVFSENAASVLFRKAPYQGIEDDDGGSETEPTLPDGDSEPEPTVPDGGSDPEPTAPDGDSETGATVPDAAPDDGMDEVLVRGTKRSDDDDVDRSDPTNDLRSTWEGSVQIVVGASVSQTTTTVKRNVGLGMAVLNSIFGPAPEVRYGGINHAPMLAFLVAISNPELTVYSVVAALLSMSGSSTPLDHSGSGRNPVASRLMWKMALAPLPADVGDSYIT